MGITVNESTRIDRWLATVLKADATLNAAVGGRVFEGNVPVKDPPYVYPAVVFASLGFGDDSPATGQSGRLVASGRYVVKGIAEGNSYTVLQTIADRIESVLNAKRGGAADVGIVWCVRKRPFKMKDQSVANKPYVHLGAEFDIAAQYQG